MPRTAARQSRAGIRRTRRVGRSRRVLRRYKRAAKNLYGPVQNIVKTVVLSKTIKVGSNSSHVPATSNYGYVYGADFNLSTDDIALPEAYELRINSVDVQCELMSLGPVPQQWNHDDPGNSGKGYYFTQTHQYERNMNYTFGLIIRDHALEENTKGIKFRDMPHLSTCPGIQLRTGVHPQILRFRKRWIPTEPSDEDWLKAGTKILRVFLLGSSIDASGWQMPPNSSYGITFYATFKCKINCLARGVTTSVTRSLSCPVLDDWHIEECNQAESPPNLDSPRTPPEHRY